MYNTGNPVPSNTLEDMADNAQVFDNFVNSSSTTTPNRNGASVKTRAGFEADHDSQIAAHEYEHDSQMQSFEDDFDSRLAGMAFTRIGSFTIGATLTDMRQVLVLESSQGGDGHEYGWVGAFPKVVAAGATPETSGGIGAGAWVDRTDNRLRSDLNVVVKTFSSVADMVSDVSLSVGQVVETLGYYNDWVSTSAKPKGGNRYKIVLAGTGTVDGGSFIALSNGLQAKGLFIDGVYRLTQFGAYANNINDDSSYIISALNHTSRVDGEGLSYLVNSQIEIRKQIKISNAKLYANKDIDILHVDENYQFYSELSLLENVTFGAITNGIGVGIGSNDWVPRWNLHNVRFEPKLKHAINAPIILTNFTECSFVENGTTELLIFDGGLASINNRINNANTFNRCSFRSEQSGVSSVSYSIKLILGYSNIFSGCEFMVGGSVAMMQLDGVNSIIFDGSCWFEGIKSPYWLDCTSASGYKPLLISIVDSHIAVHANTNALVATLADDNGDYNTSITFEGNTEETGTNHTWRISYNKSTLVYNLPQTLKHISRNWLLAPQVIPPSYTLPAVHGAYSYRAVAQGGMHLVSNTQYPTLNLVGNSNSWLITGNVVTNNIEIRTAATTNLSYTFGDAGFNSGYDNAVTCGSAARRWSVVYASTSTISTSDEREKTFFDEELSDAVLDVWAGIDWRAFKFNDAISDKGASARVHFGLGAQSVMSAFESAGLDPFKYAILCYDAWNEITEQKDDDGNVVVPCSPAGNRYGIRYEEALAIEAALMRRTAKRLEDKLNSLAK